MASRRTAGRLIQPCLIENVTKLSCRRDIAFRPPARDGRQSESAAPCAGSMRTADAPMRRCGEAELPWLATPSNSFRIPHASMTFGALQRARRAFKSFSSARNSRMRSPTCPMCSSSKALIAPQS